MENSQRFSEIEVPLPFFATEPNGAITVGSDTDQIEQAHRLYLHLGSSERDDEVATQYLIANWKLRSEKALPRSQLS